MAMIAAIRADIAIMSASGITDGRCFHPHENASQIKQAMMASSKTRYLILDHTKFTRRALHSFAALADFDLVFTDDRIDENLRRTLTEMGVRMEVVSLGEAS